MRRTILATALTLAAFTAPALAQHAAHGSTGPNGGRLEEAGRWHAELVTKGETVSVYLSDEAGKPLPAAGFKGTAILVLDGKPARIALEPDGNRLAGTSSATLGERPKGAVRLVGPGGASASARFE